MIRVTVELVSAVSPKRNKVLGVAYLTNDLKTSVASRGALGAYDVKLSKWAPKEKEIWKEGRVDNFDRKKRGGWDLLYLALRNIVGRRNP